MHNADERTSELTHRRAKYMAYIEEWAEVRLGDDGDEFLTSCRHFRNKDRLYLLLCLIQPFAKRTHSTAGPNLIIIDKLQRTISS